MSLIHSNNKNTENREVRGIYKPNINLQFRNPICKQKFDEGILCIICEEKVKGSRGRKTHFWKINELHGHCIKEHWMFIYRPYLLGLVKKIINGEL